MTPKFPRILYVKLGKGVCGCYMENKIGIDISPFNLKVEYRCYGVSGLIRDLSATVIHELCHWATGNLNGHHKVEWQNLECDSWTLKIHSIIWRIGQRDNT
ncbi:hypothetical protein MUO83_09915 [Candidatus Bathyarchaeota archaeon]|nr:hypothetical protein [Candidatus Bathyarchaeota archaeon]